MTTTTTTTTTRSRSSKKAAVVAPQPSVTLAPWVAQATTPRNALLAALKRLKGAIDAKASMPVLTHVLFTADADRGIVLSGTDLVVGMTTHVATATVVRSFAVTVPYVLLCNIVNTLSSDPIDFSLDERTHTLRVRCGGFNGNVKGSSSDEFPWLPTVHGTVVDVPAHIFLDAVGQVLPSADEDESMSRPALAGVLIDMTGSQLTLVATDAFRLAQRRLSLTTAAPTPMQQVIVPAAAMDALRALTPADEDTLSITLGEHGDRAVSFRTTETVVTTRVIDAVFPDYKRLVPAASTTRLILDRAVVQQAANLAGFIAAKAAQKLVLTITDAGVGFASEAEHGDVTAQVDAETGEGQPCIIAVSCRYFREALAVVPTAQIALEVTTPDRPAVLRTVGGDAPDLFVLLMPMSIRPIAPAAAARG